MAAAPAVAAAYNADADEAVEEEEEEEEAVNAEVGTMPLSMGEREVPKWRVDDDSSIDSSASEC